MRKKNLLTSVVALVLTGLLGSLAFAADYERGFIGVGASQGVQAAKVATPSGYRELDRFIYRISAPLNEKKELSTVVLKCMAVVPAQVVVLEGERHRTINLEARQWYRLSFPIKRGERDAKVEVILKKATTEVNAVGCEPG